MENEMTEANPPGGAGPGSDELGVSDGKNREVAGRLKVVLFAGDTGEPLEILSCDPSRILWGTALHFTLHSRLGTVMATEIHEAVLEALTIDFFRIPIGNGAQVGIAIARPGRGLELLRRPLDQDDDFTARELQRKVREYLA
jgi:hypothetical protein